MGDGVGRHHQLEGIQARQQVLLHVALPKRLPLCFAHLALQGPLGPHVGVDLGDDFNDEGAGARSGVEHLHKRGGRGAELG